MLIQACVLSTNRSPLRSGATDFVLSFVNTLCFPEVCVDLFRTLQTFPWNFGCKKSHLVLVLVDVLVASIELLLDVRVSAIGIDTSLAICARISFSSGTGDVVGPVGISVSCDISCCVVSSCCVCVAALLLFVARPELANRRWDPSQQPLVVVESVHF